MNSIPVVINATVDNDMREITEIFAQEVLHGTASWAYTPPTQQEMTDKLNRLSNDNYPCLTARLESQVVGFCFASAYTDLPANCSQT